MTIVNKFQVVTAGSVVGLAAIALLSTSQSTLKYLFWWRIESTKTRFESNSEIEKSQAESNKKAADAYQQNQIAHFNQVVISNYTLHKDPPKLDWWNSVTRSKKTYVYDKYKKCVGYAFEGKFYFVKYYPLVCNNK
jgi:uncharacterized protein (DUF1015 family)